MSQKNKIFFIMIFFELLSSCNYDFFVKEEKVLHSENGFLFEYRNEYFFYKMNYSLNNLIDEGYFFKNISGKCYIVNGFRKDDIIQFYKRTKCLPVVHLNFQKISGNSTDVNFIDSIIPVPVTLNYFVSNKLARTQSEISPGYNKFFFMNNLTERDLKIFEYNLKQSLILNSFNINYGVIDIRKDKYPCLIGE